MANQTIRRRTGGAGGRGRTVAAAARAAAKRAERAQQSGAESTENAESTGDAGHSESPASTGNSERTGNAGSAGNSDSPASAGRTDEAARLSGTPRTRSADAGGSRPKAGRPRLPGAAGGLAAAATARATGPAGRRSDLVRAGLALLVLAGVIATALLGLEYREAQQTRRASEEAVGAARTMAPRILSYDHRRLDRDFAAARKHLTGSFRAEYSRTTSKVVAPTAKKYKGSVKAAVARPPGSDRDEAVSVVSAGPDKVVVLLFMNQVTESAKIRTPRVDLNRVRMTLVRTSEGWKASAVDAL